MDLGLKGARCFVAASSAGIGRAAAAELLAEGARVVICGRNEARLEQTHTELLGKGEVHALVADVQTAGGPVAVTRAAALLGGLDVLVVNQGGPPAGTFETVDDAGWAGACEGLVLSTVRMVRAALPHLRLSGRGRVIVVASTSVKQPIPNLILSSSLRMAVVGLAKSLSVELAPSAITVNVVCPGTIDTDRIRQLHEGKARGSGRTVGEVATDEARAIPLGRIGRPDEIGAVIAFLASTRASYVTGVTLAVDGGLVRAAL